MPALSESMVVAAAPEAVFDLSQDYAARLSWDPFLRSLRFLDGATEARTGVRFWVRARNGLAMEGEYVAFDRPRVVAIRMTRGPRFFREFAGSWRFREVEGGTEATFRYTFRTRGGAAGRAIIDPVVGRVFLRDIRARLRALKGAAERQGTVAT
jgi:uncharacterized protein YndB with AHSA1/START domain